MAKNINNEIPDVSHHRPVRDWNKVKESCSFLLSKATQGTTFIDNTLDTFIKNCEKNKIPYWLYTFMVKGDGKTQAKYMVDKCKGKVGKYFVGYIIDAEKNPSTGTKPTDSQVKTALDYLSSLDVKWGLYTGFADYSYYKNSITKAKNSKNGFWWEARYGNNNGAYNPKYPCNKGAALHQYTSLGTCDGISGKIDLNRVVNGVRGLDWFITPVSKPNEIPIVLPNINVSIITDSNLKSIYYKKYTGKSNQIDVVLRDIGVPNKYLGNATKRIPIASLNGIKEYNGTKEQNLKIISLAKNGKLKKIVSDASEYYKMYTGKSEKIDEVFKAIGVPSKYRNNKANRKPIATANAINNYNGTAAQNIKLVKLAKKGKLKKV